VKRHSHEGYCQRRCRSRGAVREHYRAQDNASCAARLATRVQNAACSLRTPVTQGEEWRNRISFENCTKLSRQIYRLFNTEIDISIDTLRNPNNILTLTNGNDMTLTRVDSPHGLYQAHSPFQAKIDCDACLNPNHQERRLQSVPAIVPTFRFVFWSTKEATVNDQFDNQHCAMHSRTRTTYRHSIQPDQNEPQHIDFPE
jgi:hypothetical protein